ncbi:MAG: DUF4189 domain-containing protein [Mesorhizobium sp.]|nr:DUF4189 domain-containing protein [Mesorhizobium sp.]
MRPVARVLLSGAFAVGLSLAGAGVALADFGAIAFSPQSGAYGYSYGAGTRAQAERIAMSNCRANGAGCRLLVYFRNACGALAVGNGNGYGYAWAGTRGQAEGRAMQECRNQTSSCRLVAWSCSG